MVALSSNSSPLQLEHQSMFAHSLSPFFFKALPSSSSRQFLNLSLCSFHRRRLGWEELKDSTSTLPPSTLLFPRFFIPSN